ncbi:MAG: hypothetical protein R3257_05700 [bacterium]|nr:hypothetical protein [bacterium]
MIPEQELEKGLNRVDPPCPYYGECGGCQLQHFDYPSQLIWKQRLLQSYLETLVEPEKLRPMIGSPLQWNYRRRIQVHATPKGEPGFFATGSHHVVPIESCLIAQQPLNDALPQVKEKWRNLLSKKDRPSLLTFELTRKDDGGVEMKPAGRERFFLQINPEANAVLVQHLREIFAKVGPREVLELYAGAGNFTYELYNPSLAWTSVESESGAFESGRARAQSSKVRWVHDKAQNYLKKNTSRHWDLALMDPPREGGRGSISLLVKTPVPCLAYISSSPAALHRDLKALLAGGYEVRWVQGFDFFPHTNHIESLVLLRHR